LKKLEKKRGGEEEGRREGKTTLNHPKNIPTNLGGSGMLSNVHRGQER